MRVPENSNFKSNQPGLKKLQISLVDQVICLLTIDVCNRFQFKNSKFVTFADNEEFAGNPSKKTQSPIDAFKAIIAVSDSRVSSFNPEHFIMDCNPFSARKGAGHCTPIDSDIFCFLSRRSIV